MAPTRPPIDLHTHSTFSDGTVPPADLMAWAFEIGLTVVALTDHDTLAGHVEAAASLPSGLTLVPGVELSAGFDGPNGRVSLHLLGYLVDPQNDALNHQMAAQRLDRQRRAREMVARMQEQGADVTFEQVQSLAGHDAVGRPHMATALVNAGAIDSYSDAWTKDWIATGGRCWVAKHSIEPAEAVRLVTAAGGVAVLAHPGSSGRGAQVPDEMITAMRDAGLLGLEVDHPEHDSAARDRLRGVARDLGLVVTGSSDFHGSIKKNRLGQEGTDPDVYAQILAAGTGAAPIAV